MHRFITKYRYKSGLEISFLLPALLPLLLDIGVEINYALPETLVPEAKLPLSEELC